jgi:hypothetical protein
MRLPQPYIEQWYKLILFPEDFYPWNRQVTETSKSGASTNVLYSIYRHMRHVEHWNINCMSGCSPRDSTVHKRGKPLRLTLEQVGKKWNVADLNSKFFRESPSSRGSSSLPCKRIIRRMIFKEQMHPCWDHSSDDIQGTSASMPIRKAEK